ncbi:MAG: HprK-related kinase B [Methyloprofundus sp.]|nr:HprK-related kinase B [Methyloprofundus sp.]
MNTSNTSLQAVSAQLIQNYTLLERTLFLQCGGCVIQLQSNCSPLLDQLAHYFRHISITPTTVDIRVIAIDCPNPVLAYRFQDWPREAGKKGRKDVFYDLEGGRLIGKFRTGMVFLQSATHRIVAGPCLTNSNQVINFINNQHMNWLQQQHWLICHAAGVVYNNKAYAIAAFSGGGKSTFMLCLMDNENIHFLSNDRLFIRDKNGVEAEGIAKLPRINPGTIVTNPRLQGLISQKSREQLLKLPRQQLWDLEQKYDIDIESIYGQGRIANAKPLEAFIVLNWQHNSQQDCQVTEVELNERRDLLAPIMKSSGSFYQDQTGHFLTQNRALNEQNYLSILAKVKTYEVSGKVDFAALQSYFHQYITEAK